MHRLFVYGTLTDPDICSGLLGRLPVSVPAVLRHHVRHEVRGEAYPAVVAKRGGVVRGLVYGDLTLAELDMLDAYEGGEYERVEVEAELETGATLVWVYVWVDEMDRLGPEA